MKNNTIIHIQNIILFLIKGWDINEEEREHFMECQLCTNNECCFKSCYDLAASSIFCESTSDTSQRQETGNVTRLHGNLNDLSNHLIAKELLARNLTIENCDEPQLPSVDNTQQKSSNYKYIISIERRKNVGSILSLFAFCGFVFGS